MNQRGTGFTIRLGVTVLALSFGLAACKGDEEGDGGGGADCESLCEDSNDCPGTTPSDCGEVCAEADRINDATDCGGEWDDVMDCAEGEDACGDGAACEDEVLTWSDCVEAYCTSYPDDCPV